MTDSSEMYCAPVKRHKLYSCTEFTGEGRLHCRSWPWLDGKIE